MQTVILFLLLSFQALVYSLLLITVQKDRISSPRPSVLAVRPRPTPLPGKPKPSRFTPGSLEMISDNWSAFQVYIKIYRLTKH